MVTIKDVAREANVSVATVSRVFNGGAPVREETSRRIRDIATRLRYVPHGGARSLITSKTSTIGVLLPDLYGEFFSEVIRGIDFAARRSGYHLIISSSHQDKSEIESAMRAMRGRVNGVIIMSPDIDAEALLANLPDSHPVVLLNCALRRGAFDSVNIDNTRGTRDIVQHLIGHGRAVQQRFRAVRVGDLQVAEAAQAKVVDPMDTPVGAFAAGLAQGAAVGDA